MTSIKLTKFIDFLADHPIIGVGGGVKVFIIAKMDFTTLEVAGRIFQSVGYIFGGMLAAVTFGAWFGKNILKPIIEEIKKLNK
jgi:hypothetical protein